MNRMITHTHSTCVKISPSSQPLHTKIWLKSRQKGVKITTYIQNTLSQLTFCRKVFGCLKVRGQSQRFNIQYLKCINFVKRDTNRYSVGVFIRHDKVMLQLVEFEQRNGRQLMTLQSCRDTRRC